MHLVHTQRRQAQKFNIAVVRQARDTSDLFVEDHMALAQRAPAQRGEPCLVAAEDVHHRGADRRRQMHRSGVVGDQQPAPVQECRELADIQLVGEIHRRLVHRLHHRLRVAGIVLARHDADAHLVLCGQPIRHLRKPLRHPSF